MTTLDRSWTWQLSWFVIITALAAALAGGAEINDASSVKFSVTDSLLTPPTESPAQPNCKALLDQGMKAMQHGETKAAEEAFRSGIEHCPSDSNMWLNLAAVRSALVATTADGNDKFSLYCEAKAAASLAARLGAADAKKLLQTIESSHAGRAARGSNTDRICPHDNILRALLPLVHLRSRATAQGRRIDSSEFLKSVRVACSVDTLIISLEKQERESGMLLAGTLHAIAMVYDMCGVVAVRDMFPVSQVDAAANAQVAHYYSANYDNGVDMRHRGDSLRSEVVCPLEPPFTSVVSSSASLFIAEHILQAGDVELDTFSYIHSEPGSKGQKWHTDVPALFDEKLDTGVATMPPYGLVMIVPLIDLDEHNGPTEFLPGSNLPWAALEQAGESFWHDHETGRANGDAEAISLALPKGSALLFDLRTTHRGGPNQSVDQRPILYISFVREWFQDRINFSSRQSQWWKSSSDLKHSERFRKLYSRIDSQQYTKMLENLLRDKGVDISNL